MQVIDGAYGTLLQQHLEGGEHVDDLCVRLAHVVIDAHRAYLDAGAQVVQTNSFMAWAATTDRRRIQRYEAAYSCAMDACAASGAVGATISWTIGPAGDTPRSYWYDIELALERGCSNIVVETLTTAMMVEAVTTALGEVARGVPQLGVRLGCSIDQRDAAARQWLLDVAKGVPEQIQFGVNCAAGPADMVELLRGLVEIRGATWWAPSAGEPVGDPPSWPYDSGNEWASIVAQQIGAVNATEAQQIVVGGCCGTTPKHIAALVELLHNS